MEAKMKCSQCGKINASDVNFCADCGSKIVFAFFEDGRLKSSVSKQKFFSKDLFIKLAIGLILFVGSYLLTTYISSTGEDVTSEEMVSVEEERVIAIVEAELQSHRNSIYPSGSTSCETCVEYTNFSVYEDLGGGFYNVVYILRNARNDNMVGTGCARVDAQGSSAPKYDRECMYDAEENWDGQ